MLGGIAAGAMPRLFFTAVQESDQKFPTLGQGLEFRDETPEIQGLAVRNFALSFLPSWNRSGAFGESCGSLRNSTRFSKRRSGFDFWGSGAVRNIFREPRG